MESLSCRSPDRCRTCEHHDARLGCSLEADIDAALAAMARRPAIPVQLARPMAALA